MKTETINPIKHLYETAFPPDERRGFDELQKLFAEENDMHIQIEHLNGELLGFIIYWTFEQFIYVEHFAVAEPFRGGGHGTKMFNDFLKNARLTVVLEVEPPENPVAEKRIQFYERLGMTLWRFPYTQPPYSAEKNPVDMRIMSSGDLGDESEFEKMKKVIFENVYFR
ncbi:MAG: GNAT family N-acetyltransferase [Prevotellaceae bacterium]|jgi:ribosomal protein S18 acetylase RimI-like enzyme|nr:GNAT family N-acetyltransferase [Prevotellaceae bacterium]